MVKAEIHLFLYQTIFIIASAKSTSMVGDPKIGHLPHLALPLSAPSAHWVYKTCVRIPDIPKMYE